jgi:UDP-N-acetylglucosamine kinase
MNEQEAREAAEVFVKKNKIAIARKIADISLYRPEDNPISIFMAGSPGAGKTETSKRLLEDIAMRGSATLRIDTDEYRAYFAGCGYTGANAHIFQRAATRITEKVIDLPLSQGQSFLLDGTFSNYDKARSNIERCIAKGRDIVIYFVYQDPVAAWNFVQKRELVEGRHIEKETFIRQFVDAQKTVQRIKDEFAGAVQVYFLDKTVGGTPDLVFNITHIDKHVSKKYSYDELESLIS